jgi:fructose-bisphosphate aldolase class II
VALVRTADLVDAARRAGHGIPAFNVITLEHAEGIASAAERAGRGVILQLSHNAVRFHRGSVLPIARAMAALAECAGADLALHLDHVEDTDLLHRAADAGFSSAMYDAGALPYRDNVSSTRQAVTWAHDAGLWLEAELGYVGGKPDAPVSAHAAGVFTDPEEAAAFVAETGVDGLAVAVGSSHAMTERTATLDLELITRLRERVPVPLVLHGSSGVPDDELRAAITAGIVKVNIGTALNIAYTDAVRQGVASGSSSDPRKYLAPAREAVAVAAAQLIDVVCGRP